MGFLLLLVGHSRRRVHLDYSREVLVTSPDITPYSRIGKSSCLGWEWYVGLPETALPITWPVTPNALLWPPNWSLWRSIDGSTTSRPTG
jgi:hypothetical protein